MFSIISDKKRIPSHFPSQPLSPNLHAAEGEPFLAQVLQRGAEMINCFVDAEEAVVGVVELINGDRLVLRVVAL